MGNTNVLYTGQFSNGMHAETGDADIHRGNAKLGGRDGTNGAATGHVAAHRKRLVGRGDLIADRLE